MQEANCKHFGGHSIRTDDMLLAMRYRHDSSGKDLEKCRRARGRRTAVHETTWDGSDHTALKKERASEQSLAAR